MMPSKKNEEIQLALSVHIKHVGDGTINAWTRDSVKTKSK